MDIKEKISEIVDKIKNDDDLLDSFKKDPIKTVEGLIGVDLPDDVMQKVVEGVKSKITLDNAKDALSSLTGLFKK